MNELWKKRKQNYLNTLLHYAKYVLNDHFVIALLFFMGGLALAYSKLIKGLPEQPKWWEQPVVILWLLLWLQVGRLATLLQPADVIFLAPEQYQLPGYLKKAFKHSYLVGAGWQVVAWFVILPLVGHGLNWSWPLLLGLLILQLMLKLIWLVVQQGQAFSWEKDYIWHFLIFKWLLPLSCLALYVLTSNLFSLLIPAAVIIGQTLLPRSAKDKGIFNWQQMIKNEQQRMQSIYRVINLFIDVPQIKGRIYRLRWLDGCLPSIRKSPSIYDFLFMRSFLRRSEYSGLFIRLVVLAGILQAILKGFWLPIILDLIFIYLIGFQQFPLYFTFDDNALTYLYPVDKKVKYQAFKRLNWKLMLLAAVILLVIGQLIEFDLKRLLFEIIGVLIEIWLLNNLFLLSYLKKRT